MFLYEFIEKLRKNKQGAWIGVHFSRDKAGEKIAKTGLLATLIPFGVKMKKWADAQEELHGVRPKIGRFKATISVVSQEGTAPDIETWRKAANNIVVCIPERVVKALGGDVNDSFFYEKVCGYGIQRLEYDKDGNAFLSEITPCKKNDENANVRMVLNCFIAGYFNENEEFIENPLYFENLPEEEQDRIVSSLVAEKNITDGDGK